MKVLNCVTLGQMCEAALDGEPVFIIRAQDKAAAAAVYAYIEASKTVGGTNLGRSNDQRARIIEWQNKNPDRVRAAD